jgi:hypothetical protein
VLGVAIALEAGPRLALLWAAVALSAAAAAGWLDRRAGAAAPLALAALGLYMTGVLLERARVRAGIESAARRLVQESVDRLDLLPRIPGGSARWRAVLTTGPRYYVSDAAAVEWRNGSPRLQAFERNLDDPCYREALSQAQMAAMARFARFPSVETRPGAAGCVVYLRDLRYALTSESGFGVAAAKVPARAAPAASSGGSSAGR